MSLRNVLILLLTFTVVQVFGRSFDLPKQGPASVQNVSEANLNSVFDTNIDRIRRMIYEKNLDPLEMPDRMLGITDSQLPFAKLHLTNGWVQQLATLKRTGDIVARYYKKNVTVEFDLGWNDVNVNYAYTFRALFYTRQGHFHGYFNNLRVAAQGVVNLENYYLELKFFKIVDVGHFNFELTGHIADYILNAIARAFTTLAKDRILREIEYQFENSIREKINDMNELIPEPMRKKLLSKIIENN